MRLGLCVRTRSDLTARCLEIDDDGSVTWMRVFAAGTSSFDL